MQQGERKLKGGGDEEGISPSRGEEKRTDGPPKGNEEDAMSVS